MLTWLQRFLRRLRRVRSLAGLFGLATHEDVMLLGQLLKRQEWMLDYIHRQVNLNYERMIAMAATIDDVKSAVAKETTAVRSAIVLLNQLHDLLVAA